MTITNDIYDQINNREFTDSHCFLCGVELNDFNKTKEHVIPKWIQHKFNLWDKTMVLLNRTSIFYRNLTIPCCFTCNNNYLQPFESKVENLFNNGFDSFSLIDREVLFLWLGKIYYGLMYKELFLNIDRRDSSAGSITTPEYLKSFQAHFLFLQGIRGKHKFKDFFPASIHIFRTQKIGDVSLEWDFFDSHHVLFIAIRMGEIGIVASLQDGQTVEDFPENLIFEREKGLHPLQFRELTAQILYKTMLLNRTPKYISIKHGDRVETTQLPLGGGSSKPIFDEFNPDIYVRILSQLMNLPLERVHPNPSTILTWLHDENNNPIFIDARE